MSNADTLSHPRLSAAEVAAFEDEGYLLFQRPVLAPDKFAGLADRRLRSRRLRAVGRSPLHHSRAAGGSRRYAR